MSIGDLKKIGELFCGAGGFAEGAKLAGFEHLWGTDYDTDSCISFEKNQKIQAYCMDVRKFTNKKLMKQVLDDHGKINGLLFGFPCNDFSLANKQVGKRLIRKFGRLYRYGCEALNFFQPEFFVAENVTTIAKKFKTRKEQLKEDSKRQNANNNYKNFKKIMMDLASCTKFGYNIFADNFNFEEYGVPQRRHRMILVGFRNDFYLKNKISYEKAFKNQDYEINGKYVTCKSALSNIPKDAPNQEKTIHQAQVLRRLKKTAEGKNVWDLGNDPDGLPMVKKARMSNIYKKLKRDEPAYTVTGSGGGGTHMYHYSENRALTNRERARLQTFDDYYKFEGGKESVRKQIGMAVPVLGAKLIMNSIKKALKPRERFINFHHDWFIKAKSDRLYFSGKEDLQSEFDFD